jgi:hypothetical protein
VLGDHEAKLRALIEVQAHDRLPLGGLPKIAELGVLAERLAQLEADGLRRLDVIVDGNSASSS